MITIHKFIGSLFILIALSVFPAYGQRDRNIVYQINVSELAYNNPTGNSAEKALKNVATALLTKSASVEMPKFADAVRSSVASGLSNVMRFRVSDGNSDAINEDVQVYSTDGTITNISMVTKVETGKNIATTTYYRALVSVTVNLRNPKDGTVADSHTFSISDNDMTWLKSEEKAMSNALERLTNRVTVYYDQLYPLFASIIEGADAKKDKQKEVYIDLGEADGVSKGMQFNVYTVKSVAGKEARREIGRLKIEEVSGDEISLCKVTKGGDKIKNALDDGLTLVIISR